MREIKLTQGKVTLVDDEDYDLLCLFNWYAQRDNKTFYAVRRLPRVNGKQKTEYMHRIILARKLERAIKPGMMARSSFRARTMRCIYSVFCLPLTLGNRRTA